MHRKKSIFTFNLSAISPYLSFIIFSAMFIIGILTGNILSGRIEVLTNLSAEHIGKFVSVRGDDSFLNMLKNSALSLLPQYIFMFLFGTSVIGCVTTPLIVLYKGFAYGCISGYLYFTYKLEGIIFSLLLTIPSALVSAFGLLLLAKEAFSFSYMLCGVCINANKPVNISVSFKNFYTRSLIALIPAFVAIILDIGMSVLFIDYFNF